MTQANLMYSLIDNGESQFITVVIPGEKEPAVTNDDHPQFARILAKAQAGDADGILELFDGNNALGAFEKLSERVSIRDGVLHLDGDPVHNALAKAVSRFWEDGVADWQPLVRFFERIQSNPEPHSKEQLFTWLDRHEDITLTAEGLLVGYKGVNKQADGSLLSGSRGHAIVDGVEHNGQIPNEPGTVVEMPRSEVQHDPRSACSTGLHVGTFRYAKGFARGAMLEVHVDPRDVVSVPHDASGEKIRVCRYTVVKVIDAPYSTILVPEEEALEEDEPDDYYVCYGDGSDAYVSATNPADAIDQANDAWGTSPRVGEEYGVSLEDDDTSEAYRVVGLNPTRVLDL